MKRPLRRILPAVLWMVLIFLFSASPGDESGRQSGRLIDLFLNFVRLCFGRDAAQWIMDTIPLQFLVRKLAHFCEYAVLGILMVRAWENCAGALVICSLYACTDEVHQYFVPGRAMQFRDVLIDSAGALFGIGLVALWRWRKRGERG